MNWQEEQHNQVANILPSESERLEIYIKVREISEMWKHERGLCLIIRDIIACKYELGYYAYFYIATPKKFPELYAHAPIGYDNMTSWFNSEEREFVINTIINDLIVKLKN